MQRTKLSLHYLKCTCIDNIEIYMTRIIQGLYNRNVAFSIPDRNEVEEGRSKAHSVSYVSFGF
jgi:hypothetical protein